MVSAFPHTRGEKCLEYLGFANSILLDIRQGNASDTTTDSMDIDITISNETTVRYSQIWFRLIQFL